MRVSYGCVCYHIFHYATSAGKYFIRHKIHGRIILESIRSWRTYYKNYSEILSCGFLVTAGNTPWRSIIHADRKKLWASNYHLPTHLFKCIANDVLVFGGINIISHRVICVWENE